MLLPYLAGRPIRTRTTITLSHIAEILTDIDLLGQAGKRQLLQAVETGPDSFTMNQKVGALLKLSGGKEITAARLLSGDGLFQDAWGTPLLFMPTNSTSYQLLNPDLKGKSRPVVVWSAGPNKTNEFGNGDDVVSFR